MVERRNAAFGVSLWASSSQPLGEVTLGPHVTSPCSVRYLSFYWCSTKWTSLSSAGAAAVASASSFLSSTLCLSANTDL